MSKDNKIVMVTTTNHGILYYVFHKDDPEQKTILYTGELSSDPKHNYCTCTGYAILEKCYHQDTAKSIMEIPIQ